MDVRRSLRVVIVPLVVIAAAAAAGSWASGRASDVRPALTIALSTMPSDVVDVGFTDWAAIRDTLGVDGATTGAGRATLRDEGTLRDLTTRSVLGGVIDDMHAAYGWSAADLAWEVYGRAATGAAMVARFADSVSLDDVEDRLSELGYTRQGEVWSLDQTGVSTVTPELAATLGHLAIDRDRRLVVAADRAAHVPDVLATVRGDEPSALGNRPLADVARTLLRSDTALLQAPAFGCRATSPGAGGETVLAQAGAALSRAGALTSPRFTGRGLVDGPRDQTITFASAFGSPSEAARQLRVREQLTTGPFIGRTGRIEDVLERPRAAAEGTVTTLRFSVDPDKAAFMSGEGPILFASCPSL